MTVAAINFSVSGPVGKLHYIIAGDSSPTNVLLTNNSKSGGDFMWVSSKGKSEKSNLPPQQSIYLAGVGALWFDPAQGAQKGRIGKASQFFK